MLFLRWTVTTLLSRYCFWLHLFICLLYTLCPQKNASTSAICSFNKHGLVLIIFGKQHQHTFKNDMHIQLSLSLHFLLALFAVKLRQKWRVLASSYAHETVKLLQLETLDFICPDLFLPNSPIDPETRLTTEFGDWCRNVCTLYTWPRHKLLDATRQWHMGKHIKKRRSCWSMEKVVVCMHKGKRTSLWTSAELKLALFRADTLHNRLFSEPTLVYQGKRVVSHLHCSYLTL